MPTLLEYSPPSAPPAARHRRRWTSLVLGLPAAVVPVAPLAAMLIPYVANATFCLIGFADKPQLGWYLTLVSAPAAALELTITAVAAILRWRRAWLTQTEGPAG